MENILFNELINRDFNVDMDLVCVSGKDASGKLVRKQLELDFCATKAPSVTMFSLRLQFRMKRKCSRKLTLCFVLMIPLRKLSSSKILLLPGTPMMAFWLSVCTTSC